MCSLTMVAVTGLPTMHWYCVAGGQQMRAPRMPLIYVQWANYTLVQLPHPDNVIKP